MVRTAGKVYRAIFDERTGRIYNGRAVEEAQMEQGLMIIVVVLVLAVAGLLVWLIRAISAGNQGVNEKLAGQQAAVTMLQQQLDSLRSGQEATRETLNKTLLDSQANLTRNLQSSVETLNKLHTQIGQVQTAGQQMQRVGEDMKRLEEILASPKLRGGLGEWSLENLLVQVLPKDSYELQFTLKDGQKVDAMVRLADYAVPIDAKFPLSAFEKVTASQNDEEKGRNRRQFHSDVIRHIDKIAAGYIRPAEGTVDFAMMYIPAENVYYETIVRYTEDTKDILRYSQDKKVIPVSPNLLYAYLMTVVMGLHGLQIEKQAAEIRQNLKKLNADFSQFVSTWDVLGKHLRNAYAQYDDGQKKLDRFGMQLNNIQSEYIPNE